MLMMTTIIQIIPSAKYLYNSNNNNNNNNNNDYDNNNNPNYSFSKVPSRGISNDSNLLLD